MTRNTLLFVLVAVIVAGTVPEGMARQSHRTTLAFQAEQPAHYDLPALHHLNQKTGTVLNALAQDDTKPLYAALLPDRQERGTREIAHILKIMMQAHGPLQSFQVLGTAPRTQRDAITLVQLVFPKATEVVHLRWYGDRLVTLQRIVPPTYGHTHKPSSPASHD